MRMQSALPTILGINAVYHETAACLLRGPELVAFAEEERLNRRKKGKPARVDNADELPLLSPARRRQLERD